MNLSLAFAAFVACSVATPSNAFIQQSRANPAFGVARGQSSASALYAVSKDSLKGAQDMIDGILDEKNCGPVVRERTWVPCNFLLGGLCL